MINWHDGFFVANNYSSSTVNFVLPADSKIIIGSKEMTPAGVLVWR